jgi:hypothetical protein
VKKDQIKFWAVFLGLLLLGWWIYSRVKATATDANTAVHNLYTNPLKTLFG